MYLDVRKSKSGVVTYRFTFIGADGRRRRYPQSKVPLFKDRAAAEDWAKSQAAMMEAKKAYIALKLSWRSQYYQFDDLLATYGRWQKEKAPNSWQSSVYYLEQWVFPFFLQEKGLVNINDWHLYLQDYVDWLKRDDVAVKQGRKTALAASTVNNIVKSFNTFQACMLAYNKIDPASVRKAPTLPDHCP